MALAAIQGLAQRLDEKDERIDSQANHIEELEERLAALEAQGGSTGLASADD